MTLHVWRTEQPETLHKHLHMWPDIYGALLLAIHHDIIFSNSSNNEQINPAEQHGDTVGTSQLERCATLLSLLGHQQVGLEDMHIAINFFQTYCMN